VNKPLLKPSVAERYRQVRQSTLHICENLELEDYIVQPDVDVSPPKWHLAHTTWFFERLVLQAFSKNYKPYQEHFNFLFNSYYEAIGNRSNRQDRGCYSRPTVKEVLSYRQEIDERMLIFIKEHQGTQREIDDMIELALQHEQQHQELLWTDIKFILFYNDVTEPYVTCTLPNSGEIPTLKPIMYDIGTFQIGHSSDTFCFDNEQPSHRIYLEPFEIANRPVTNGEYLEFIKDGGYQDHRHWLADGWTHVQQNKWLHPLYWLLNKHEEPRIFTLHGLIPLNLNEPVTHISYYEADAFARWSKARLPSEFEWEVMSQFWVSEQESSGPAMIHPSPLNKSNLEAVHGSVWQWTDSAYRPYPRFQPRLGLAEEYNGKFMSNQIVLRGSSCATPKTHARNTYRNFFHPDKRWQFSGLRLAW
jgi:ergothioneine biosynthesis protein EgtB